MSKLKTAAKFVGGILGIVLFTSALAKYVFNKKVENEVEELLSHAKNSGEIVTQEDLAELPLNVRKWLEYTGVIGKKKLVSVHLKQEATLRLDADKPWLPVKAE